MEDDGHGVGQEVGRHDQPDPARRHPPRSGHAHPRARCLRWRPLGFLVEFGLRLDEINAAGGVDGRKLSLTVEDEACDPKTAAAGAAKLVTAKINISVGGYCSGATLPTLTIFEKANIPMLIPAANSADLLKGSLKNVFLINGTGIQQAQAAADFIKAEGSKAVALVDDNTSYSKDITTRAAENLKTAGVTVANQQSVTAGESDYSGAVTAITRLLPGGRSAHQAAPRGGLHRQDHGGRRLRRQAARRHRR